MIIKTISKKQKSKSSKSRSTGSSKKSTSSSNRKSSKSTGSSSSKSNNSSHSMDTLNSDEFNNALNLLLGLIPNVNTNSINSGKKTNYV